jgi:hypothetical protein
MDEDKKLRNNATCHLKERTRLMTVWFPSRTASEFPRVKMIGHSVPVSPTCRMPGCRISLPSIASPRVADPSMLYDMPGVLSILYRVVTKKKKEYNCPCTLVATSADRLPLRNLCAADDATARSSRSSALRDQGAKLLTLVSALGTFETSRADS